MEHTSLAFRKVVHFFCRVRCPPRSPCGGTLKTLDSEAEEKRLKEIRNCAKGRISKEGKCNLDVLNPDFGSQIKNEGF